MRFSRANSPKFFRAISISTLLQKLGCRRSREVVPSGANRVCGNEEAFFHATQDFGGKVAMYLILAGHATVTQQETMTRDSVTRR